MLWLFLVLAALMLIILRRPHSRQSQVASKPPKRPSKATGIEVVCVTVTPERQEWRSLKTGRLYDVTAAKGLLNAQEGDRAMIAMGERGWHIQAKQPRAQQNASHPRQSLPR